MTGTDVVGFDLNGLLMDTLLELRTARLADSAFLVALRNEPENARRSRRGVLPGSVVEQDYLRNPDKTCLIIETLRRPIGYAVFADVGDGCFDVSIALLPQIRGAGLGRRAIADASRHWLEARPHARLLAEIHRDNSRSRRAFAAAGYAFLRRMGVYDVYVFPKQQVGQ